MTPHGLRWPRVRDREGDRTPGGAQLTYDDELWLVGWWAGGLVGWQDQPTSPTTTDGFAYDGEGNCVAREHDDVRYTLGASKTAHTANGRRFLTSPLACSFAAATTHNT